MEKRPCLPLRYVCNIVVIPLQEDNRPSQPTASSFSSCTLQGVRRVCAASDGGQHGFQSTHSLRSATFGKILFTCGLVVSIHALLAECDYSETETKTDANAFQSTHSLRSATGQGVVGHCQGPVSIHALLAECDLTTASCSERLTRFQSTHSLRSATRRGHGSPDGG